MKQTQDILLYKIEKIFLLLICCFYKQKRIVNPFTNVVEKLMSIIFYKRYDTSSEKNNSTIMSVKLGNNSTIHMIFNITLIADMGRGGASELRGSSSVKYMSFLTFFWKFFHRNYYSFCIQINRVYLYVVERSFKIF